MDERTHYKFRRQVDHSKSQPTDDNRPWRDHVT